MKNIMVQKSGWNTVAALAGPCHRLTTPIFMLYLLSRKVLSIRACSKHNVSSRPS